MDEDEREGSGAFIHASRRSAAASIAARIDGAAMDSEVLHCSEEEDKPFCQKPPVIFRFNYKLVLIPF